MGRRVHHLLTPCGEIFAMAYSNELKGSLFRNERKRDEKDPSHQGSCEINGQQFWISAWIQEAGPKSKNPGQKFFSLAFKPKDAPAKSPAPAPQPQQPIPAAQQDDEEIPF